MRLKITQPGFAGYTGELGMTKFEDGVCDHVSAHEAIRLGSILHMTEIDDKGEHIGPVGVTVDAIRVHSLSAPMEVKLKTQAQIDEENAAEKAAEDAKKAVVPPPPSVTEVAVVEEGKVFTREELEKIADEKGINGLRPVGAALNVKSNAIDKLIDAILEAQAAKIAAAPAAPTEEKPVVTPPATPA